MKKLLSAIVFVIILLSLAPLHQSFAAIGNNWVFNDFPRAMEKAIDKDGVNSPGFGSHMQLNNESFLIMQTFGAVPNITVTADAYQRNPEYVRALNNGSAIAGISNYIAMIYSSPPASTSLAIQDFGQSLGFLPKRAYAQGVGFNALQPLLGIWRVFRNIAYLLLAVIMIAIGFMVMFRKKIDPKTVVTVQNALPRIVVTLLLITFSYAIAGILIDLMYLLMLLILNLLVGAYPNIFGSDTVTGYMSGGLDRAAGNLFWGGWAAIDDLVKMIFWGQEGGFKWWTNLIISIVSGSLVFDAQYVLVWLIVSIALLFGFVRIFFMLLTSYIQIVIAVLVGPMQILFDALPGGTSFSSWIKNLISNLSVFPITAGMFLIGTIMARAEVDLWTPPLLGGPDATTRGITGLIGLGVLLTIPTVAGSIKEALKAKPPVGLGGALGPVGGISAHALQLGSMAWSHKIAKDQTGAIQELVRSIQSGQSGGSRTAISQLAEVGKSRAE